MRAEIEKSLREDSENLFQDYDKFLKRLLIVAEDNEFAEFWSGIAISVREMVRQKQIELYEKYSP